jgi:hypothetical protein
VPPAQEDLWRTTLKPRNRASVPLSCGVHRDEAGWTMRLTPSRRLNHAIYVATFLLNRTLRSGVVLLREEGMK